MRRAGFVNQGLRPRHIVVLAVRLARKLGNAVVDQLARRLFDRSEVAGCDVRLDPRFLFGGKGNRHAFLYLKAPDFDRENTLPFCPYILPPITPCFLRASGMGQNS